MLLLSNIGTMVGPDMLDKLASESKNSFFVRDLILMDMDWRDVESVILVGRDHLPCGSFIILFDVNQ